MKPNQAVKTTEVTAILVESKIFTRLKYGTTGITLKFRDVESGETHIRTFNYGTNLDSKKLRLNHFLKVILGNRDTQELRENKEALLEELVSSDDRFFRLLVTDSGKASKGRPVKNILSIKERKLSKEEVKKVTKTLKTGSF